MVDDGRGEGGGVRRAEGSQRPEGKKQKNKQKSHRKKNKRSGKAAGDDCEYFSKKRPNGGTSGTGKRVQSDVLSRRLTNQLR